MSGPNHPPQRRSGIFLLRRYSAAALRISLPTSSSSSTPPSPSFPNTGIWPSKAQNQPPKMASTQVLLQFGDNPFNMKLKDAEGRLACTVEEVGRNPNPIIRLTREAQWAQQHPSIMGPDNSFYYLGPENRPGYMIYGNNRSSIPMVNLMKKKNEGSSSRYFTTLGGRECKWKRLSVKKMECVDGRTTIAVWEMSDPDDDHSATLTIKPAGMSVVTEILTTLTLNLMAQMMDWPDS